MALGVLRLLPTVPWIGLQCVLVVTPDHTQSHFRQLALVASLRLALHAGQDASLPMLPRVDCSCTLDAFKVLKWRHCYIKLTSSCNIASKRTQADYYIFADEQEKEYIPDVSMG